MIVWVVCASLGYAILTGVFWRACYMTGFNNGYREAREEWTAAERARALAVPAVPPLGAEQLVADSRAVMVDQLASVQSWVDDQFDGIRCELWRGAEVPEPARPMMYGRPAQWARGRHYRRP